MNLVSASFENLAMPMNPSSEATNFPLLPRHNIFFEPFFIFIHSFDNLKIPVTVAEF